MGGRGCNQRTFPAPNMAPYLADVRNNVWTCHVDTGVSYRVRRRLEMENLQHRAP